MTCTPTSLYFLGVLMYKPSLLASCFPLLYAKRDQACQTLKKKKRFSFQNTMFFHSEILQFFAPWPTLIVFSELLSSVLIFSRYLYLVISFKKPTNSSKCDFPFTVTTTTKSDRKSADDLYGVVLSSKQFFHLTDIGAR